MVGGISSVIADRYVKSHENKMILFIGANSFYGHSMSQQLLYDEIKIDGNVKLEDNLCTPVDSDSGCLLEIDIENPDERKDKTKNFAFYPGKKTSPQDKFRKLMKDMKSNENSFEIFSYLEYGK